MTFLLLLMILAAAVGGFCLWFSGLLFGRRARSTHDNQTQAKILENQATLNEELVRVRTELESSRERLTETEDERTRLQSELDRLKAEAEQADGELEKLREQLEKLREQPPKRAEMKTPAKPIEMVPAGPADSSEGDADSALAELDIERVAHRETRAELEKLKAEVMLLKSESSAKPSVPPAPGRGARFQTVSIATRSEEVPAFEHDRLRAAFETLKREKEQIEAEHARTLEQLKLQALQSSDD